MKYHQTKDGFAAPCKATVKACPLGEEAHGEFASPAEAQAWAEASLTDTHGLLPANVTRDVQQMYKREAVTAFEDLNEAIRDAENDEGLSHLRHQRLAVAHEKLMVAAESYRLRAVDEDEKRQWNRTAAKAHLNALEHEKVALQMVPREQRGDRQHRRAAIEKLEKQIRDARDEFVDVKEHYRDSPASASEMATELHEKWAEERNFEPRLKDDGEGGEVDIANTPFVNLPAKWQAENMAAARSALSRTEESEGNVELAAALIHDDWLARNGEWAEPAQKVKYSQLDEVEKEKDRVLARSALKFLNS